MLNTVHLQTFLAVVDAGSFSAAAERLHMSQPAVSQQIRALEEQVGGVRLFRRSGQRMVPTLAGEELLANARDLIALAERTAQSVIALRGRIGGRVVVGCAPGSAERLLPRLLGLFHSQHRAVTIEIELGPTDLLLDGLIERRLALALLAESPRRRSFEARTLAGERLALVAPAGHPLLQQDQVPPGVLRDHPLALPRPGNPLRRLIEEGLRRRGVAAADLRVALEADSPLTLLEAAQCGMALAFLPASLLPSRHETLGVVELAGQPLVQEWQLLRARDRPDLRAADLLYETIFSEDARGALLRLGLTPAP